MTNPRFGSPFKLFHSLVAAMFLAGACGGDAANSNKDAATASAEIVGQAFQNHSTVRSCGDAMPGYVRCHAVKNVMTNAAGQIQPFASAPGGFNPVDLISAYALPTTGGAGLTIAIVDAMDAVNAESDLATYRSQFGLPACTTANGCFRKVNQNGAASPLPASDSGWAEEISLDIDMASAICPSCKILLVEATSPTTANLGAAVNTAVSLGATVVSNSYGGSESSTDPSTTNSFYNHPGVLITASSGDGGFGVEYPAAATTILAVGGTHLVRSSTARGWTETVWGTASNANGGAGSGCSTVETKPTWQHDTGCARRTVADASAVADPATGVSVFDSVSGGWLVFGGTSVASPVVASIFALTGHGAATPQYPYANTSQFNDVTSGTNGSCGGSYLCTAVVGYDGPTGIGTPIGSAMAGGVTPPANNFSITATPATASSVAGTAGTTTSTIATATTSGSAQTVSLSVSGGGTGVTGSLSVASVTSGGSATLTVTKTAAAAAGTYAFTVTGTAASGSHSTTYTLTVTAAGGTCTTTSQLLVNPGFESGTTGWTVTAGVLGNGSVSPNVARTGAQFAWLDGYGTTHTDTLAQSVAIPAGACTAVFTYWLRIQTAETTTTTAFDKLTLTNGATTLQSFSNLNKNTAYVQQSVNLISFKGTTVALKFTGTEDSSLQTSFQIDDTAVTVTQ
jgi:hypothetical protein